MGQLIRQHYGRRTHRRFGSSRYNCSSTNTITPLPLAVTAVQQAAWDRNIKIMWHIRKKLRFIKTKTHQQYSARRHCDITRPYYGVIAYTSQDYISARYSSPRHTTLSSQLLSAQQWRQTTPYLISSRITDASTSSSPRPGKHSLSIRTVIISKAPSFTSNISVLLRHISCGHPVSR